MDHYARQNTNLTALPGPAIIPGISPKKQAVLTAIDRASGEWILTTDADCVAPRNWLRSMCRAMSEDTALVASWLQVPGTSRLSRLESLDSLGFVLIGAAFFGLGRPFMANAANMAYRKDVFSAVGGFSGIERTGSGDDDLLLQKIHAAGKWRMVFQADPANSVRTGANRTLVSFVRQRARWASKSAHYPPGLVLLETAIFAVSVMALLAIPLTLTGTWSPVSLIIPLTKFTGDGLFMRRGCAILKRDFVLRDFIGAEILQLLYLPVVAVAGQLGRYRWKGRSFDRGVLRGPF